jgi:Domain of unknown function (DUF4160)
MSFLLSFGWFLLLAANFGFNARELSRLQDIIVEHRQELLEAWNGYFGIGR